MVRSKKPFIWLALVSAMFLGEPPPAARADFTLYIYDNGSLVASKSGSSPLTLVGNSPDFSFDVVTGTSNTPGSSNGNVSLSSITVYSLNSGPNTFTAVLSANDFTSPPSPTLLSNSATVNVTGTVNGTVTEQGYVDTSNTLYSKAPTVGGTVYSPGAQGFTVSGSLTNAASNSNALVSFPSPAGDYSLTEVFTYVSKQDDTDGGANAGSNYVTSTGNATVTATPAPSGVILAASALPMLAGGWFLRRRKQLQLA